MKNTSQHLQIADISASYLIFLNCLDNTGFEKQIGELYECFLGGKRRHFN